MDAATGTPNEQLEAIGTLRIASDRLRYAQEGGIVEDPDLLEKVSALVAAASRIELATIQIGEIRATEGAYLVDVLAKGDPSESSATLNALLEDFDQGRAVLEENANLEVPRSASQCGVGVEMLEVLKITSALKGQERPVQIVAPGGGARDVAAPEPSALVAVAAESHQKKPKKVNGEVVGIGRGDGRGCTVRVGKASDFLVRGLALEKAWDALSRRLHITGVARWEEGIYLLEEESYELVDQGAFEL